MYRIAFSNILEAIKAWRVEKMSDLNKKDFSLGKESLEEEINSICACLDRQRLERILEISCSQAILATVQGEQIAQEIVAGVKKEEAYKKIESLFTISCKEAKGTGGKRRELFGGEIKERNPEPGEYDIVLEKR